MKTPWYETSPGATAALLATGLWVDCDMYTITSADGSQILRYTAGAIDVNVSSVIWYANRTLIDTGGASRGHWKIGTGVDQWQVCMAPRAYDAGTGSTNADTIYGQPWLNALRAGLMDGADVRVDRAFFSVWPALPAAQALPTGVVTLFRGILGNIDVGRTEAAFTINSYMDLLTLPSPRNVFQSGCRYTLFDSGCSLTAGSFVQAGTCSGGTTNVAITSSIGAPGGSGTYALGRVVMTSGNNNTFSRAVRSWSGGVLTLVAPFYYDLQVGDTFNAYPGCAKTMAQCTLFSNLVNFGGQPYIPAASTAL